MTSACPETVLYSALGADPDLIEIVEMFVDEMPDRIAAIQRLLDAQDWAALRRTAHQLKGAAGSYGFDAVSPQATAVEDANHNQQPEEQVRAAVAELLDLCRRVRAGAPG